MEFWIFVSVVAVVAVVIVIALECERTEECSIAHSAYSHFENIVSKQEIKNNVISCEIIVNGYVATQPYINTFMYLLW